MSFNHLVLDATVLEQISLLNELSDEGELTCYKNHIVQCDLKLFYVTGQSLAMLIGVQLLEGRDIEDDLKLFSASISTGAVKLAKICSAASSVLWYAYVLKSFICQQTILTRSLIFQGVF